MRSIQDCPEGNRVVLQACTGVVGDYAIKQVEDALRLSVQNNEPLTAQGPALHALALVVALAKIGLNCKCAMQKISCA